MGGTELMSLSVNVAGSQRYLGILLAGKRKIRKIMAGNSNDTRGMNHP